MSAPMAQKLGAEAALGWPPGVYFFGAELFRAGLVITSELPREPSTLLVRIMGAGPVLRQAIADLATLPADAPERAIAEQIVLDLRHALVKKSITTLEEQEFIVTMHKTWEDARREARAEGVATARAQDVLTVLRVRGIGVTAAARRRILAEKDNALLERWHERAVFSASVAEVLDDRR